METGVVEEVRIPLTTGDDEGPVHEVELPAYFLSKYEMTQGQWLAATGSSPSYYQPPSSLAPSLLHPVEQVAWPARWLAST